ncbi:unnamed protein product, partial [Ectocarpus fasciculatus]
RYVALLRGINVGGVTVKMNRLKLMFEKLGFHDVKTVLATGNVLFSSPDESQPLSELKEKLESALADTFNYTAYVHVYRFGDIKTLVDNYSDNIVEGKHSYFVFVGDSTTFRKMKAESNKLTKHRTFETVRFSDEECQICGIVYWNVTIGHSTTTEFAKLIAKPTFKNAVTTRNLNTLNKLIHTES